MKALFFNYLFFSTALLFSSCQSAESNVHALFERDLILEVSPQPGKSLLDISPLYQSHAYEVISMPEEILLGKIHCSKVVQNKLYIHDILKSQILVFDLNNKKYLYQIYCKGEGPEEYQDIYGFDVDQKGRVYIQDYGRKVLVFKDGKLEEEMYDLKLTASDIFKSDAGFIVDTGEAFKTPSAYVEINDVGEALRVFGDISKGEPMIPIKFFQADGDKVYINDAANGQLLQYDQKLGTVTKIDFANEESNDYRLIDFAVFNDEMVLAALNTDKENKVVITSVDNDGSATNYANLIFSKDMLPIYGFPSKERGGTFDYAVYSEETYPS